MMKLLGILSVWGLLELKTLKLLVNRSTMSK